MSVDEMVLNLPKGEKIRLIGSLWSGLGTEPGSLSSPAWRAAELEATKNRHLEGLEESMDWEAAKRFLLAAR